MNHATLRTLIQPRIDAGDTDAQILAWLHEPVTVARDVEWTDYMLWLSSTGGLKKLKDAEADAVQSDAVRNAAGLALVVAQAGQPISLSRPDVRAALAPLVGPVFTVAEKDALLALSDVTMERWETWPLGRHDDTSWLDHIAKARAI